MCNACGFLCCGSDQLGECGCDHCDEPACHTVNCWMCGAAYCEGECARDDYFPEDDDDAS